MASMTGRSPDVPGISPNISRSVVDRSRSRAGRRSADGADHRYWNSPRVGGWLPKKASIAGGIFLSARGLDTKVHHSGPVRFATPSP